MLRFDPENFPPTLSEHVEPGTSYYVDLDRTRRGDAGDISQSDEAFEQLGYKIGDELMDNVPEPKVEVTMRIATGFAMSEAARIENLRDKQNFMRGIAAAAFTKYYFASQRGAEV